MLRPLLLLLCGGLLAGCATTARLPLRTVPHVDLNRYMGDWYVIANIPYVLENGKVATLDRYAPRPDGRMDNIFIFRKGSFDAPEQQWHGISWVHNRETNAEWRVQFIWPFRVPYLVIDLDPDYHWAVIGHPSRNYFWILARARSLPDDVYRGILERAAGQGYDTSRIAKVPQPPEN
jgi:apolipoprotein D and lipocalin family protein